MSNIEKDRTEILTVHKNWWVANESMDIPLMRTCFPTGMNYLMFNYNWHPYFGLAEKTQLWEYYRGPGLSMVGPPDVRIMKLEVIGDLAYIACELQMTTLITQTAGLAEEVQSLPNAGEPLVERARATEIYKRDDGQGRPLWKMWHFHSSPLPPPDQPRPAFNDTAQSRGGLGWNPWGEPLSVVGPGRG